MKKLNALLPLLLVVGALSSCQSSSSSSTTNPDGPETGTITIWTTTGQNNRAPLEAAIAQFEKETGWKVNNVYQTGSYDDLKKMVIDGFPANNYPDLVVAYPDHVAEYISAGKAVNLDPYINNPEYGFTAEDKEDYYSTFMEEGQSYTVKGTYSLPFSKSTEAMYFNEGKLLNLDLSKIDATINGGKPLNYEYLDNLTWEELFGKLAPALMKYDEQHPDFINNNTAFSGVLAYDSDDNLFITLANQYGIPYTSVGEDGKGHADFNNDEMKALLTKFGEYAEKGYICTKGKAEDKYTNEFFNQDAFLFSVGSTGGVKYQFSDDNPANIGVLHIPHAEGKPRKVINQGPSLCILDHGSDAQKVAAFKLYKTLTSTENATMWSLQSGYMGVRKSFYQTDEYLAASDSKNAPDKSIDRLMALNWEYVSKVGDDLYASPAFVGSSACRQAVKGLMTQVMIDGADADIDALFKEAYNQALAGIK